MSGLRFAVAGMEDAGGGLKRFASSGTALALGRMGLFVLVLVIWQYLPSPAARFWISDPVSIGTILLAWIQDGTLLRNIVATLQVMVAGYGVGCLCGIAFGLLFGLVRPLDRVLSPFVFAAYSLPKIALIPLFIILYGVGFESKFMLVTLVVFFMLFGSTIDGVRNVDPDVVMMVRLMGATQGELVRKVFVPAIKPWIFTGMRIAVNTAFSNTLLAELLAANSGIGYLIINAANQYDAAGTYAAVLVLVAASVLLTEVLSLIEKRMAA